MQHFFLSFRCKYIRIYIRSDLVKYIQNIYSITPGYFRVYMEKHPKILYSVYFSVVHYDHDKKKTIQK